METKAFIKKEIPLWIIILLPMVYMVLVWNKLPEQLPIHWNVQGQIDNYGPKWIFPIITVVIYVLMLLVPQIDPRRKNYEKFGKSYYIIRLLLMCFFSIIFSTVITSGLGIAINIERIIVPSLLVLFMVIGNYMSTLRFNWFIGIRTPWTMTNEDIWRKTHFFAGRLWFWTNLIALPISFLFSNLTLYVFLLTIVTSITIAPIIYSYLLFRKNSSMM
jgi:uncharacterized membrane protein